jgi:hypothetical protein
MATTTNYGWTTPDDTSLVKDGASAIRTLGSSIDTSLNNALGTKKAGLVLLNTTSFSAVASVSLPADTFTTTYDNYRIVLNKLDSPANPNIYLRLRAASTDETGATYAWSYTGARANNTTFNNGGNATTFINLLSCRQVPFGGASIDLYSPKLADVTGVTCQWNGGESGWFNFGTTGGNLNNTTSYDSASLVASSSTISGVMSVYGYNK